MIDLTAGAPGFSVPVGEAPGATEAAGGGSAVDVGSTVRAEIAAALSTNVESELTRVRDAITQAEVRAVAAETRIEGMRGEQGRLQAQLKRAEADAEYWRSQHDRLDRDLETQRVERATLEAALAAGDAAAKVAKNRTAELSAEVAASLDRERALIADNARAGSELNNAMMAMGWWSRRRLARRQPISGNGNEPTAR